MLGVYLPTIQHILGVTMFIRLFWVVGVAGVWSTLLLLLLCCACVSAGISHSSFGGSYETDSFFC